MSLEPGLWHVSVPYGMSLDIVWVCALQMFVDCDAILLVIREPCLLWEMCICYRDL